MKGIAVVGTGYWGKNHLRVFKELMAENKIESLVICDIDEKKSKKFSKIFNVDYEKDYRNLLKAPNIEGVSIVTPSKTHYKIAKDFMEAGKDVMVEKPMTMNSREAEQLVKVAEKNDRILMVGHIFRHHPAMKELKKRLDRRDFGKIYYLNSTRSAFGVPRKDMGVLFALAIHDVDMFCYLLNRDYPTELYAKIGSYLQPNIEETAFVIMDFPNNVKAYSFDSWLSPASGKQRELIAVGSNMTARIDYLKPQELQVFDSSIISTTIKGTKTFVLENEGNYTIPLGYKEPLKEELAHFIECANTHKQPISDMYSGKRAVELIELAMKSAKYGKAIKIKN